MRIVATLLEDFDSGRKRLVDGFDVKRAGFQIEEVSLDEVSHVNTDDFLEQIRCIDGQFAPSFRFPLGSVVCFSIIDNLTVQHDWHLRARGEAAFVCLKTRQNRERTSINDNVQLLVN